LTILVTLDADFVSALKNSPSRYPFKYDFFVIMQVTYWRLVSIISNILLHVMLWCIGLDVKQNSCTVLYAVK